MDNEVKEILDRSIALNREGRLREREELMRGAIRKYPFSPDILLQAGATFLLSAPEGTAALAHRAVGISPDDPAVLFRAAHLLFAAQEFDASREYLARLEPLMTPEFPLLIDAIHLAGRHALQRGDVAEAEKALTTAFERDPETLGHGEILANLYEDQGRTKDALEVVRRARAYRPDDARLAEMERALAGDS